MFKSLAASLASLIVLILTHQNLHAQNFGSAVQDAIQALDAETQALETPFALIEGEEFSNNLRRMSSDNNDLMQMQRVGGTSANGASGGSFMQFDFSIGTIPDAKKYLSFPIKNLQAGLYTHLYVSMKGTPDSQFYWNINNGPKVKAVVSGTPVNCTEGSLFQWYPLSTQGTQLPLRVDGTVRHALNLKPASNTLSLDAFLLTQRELPPDRLCGILRAGSVAGNETAFFTRSAIGVHPRSVPNDHPVSLQLLAPKGAWAPATFFVNSTAAYDSIRVEMSQPISTDGTRIPWRSKTGKQFIRIQKITGTSRLIDLNYKTWVPDMKPEWDTLGEITCRIRTGTMTCNRPLRLERSEGLFGFFLDINSRTEGIYNSTIKLSGVKGSLVTPISSLSLKVVTLPFTLPVPAKDHGMYIRDRIRKVKGGYTGAEFDVLIEHGVRVPIYRELGIQNTNSSRDGSLATLTTNLMKFWKSKVDKAEEGLDGRRNVRQVNWVYNLLNAYARTREMYADPVFYSNGAGLNPTEITEIQDRLRSIYSQISVPGVEAFFGLADEVSARYKTPPIPDDTTVLNCLQPRPRGNIRDTCLNNIGTAAISYRDSWRANIHNLYAGAGIPFYLTLRFLDLTAESNSTEIEDFLGEGFRRTPSGILNYSGGSYDWSSSTEKEEKTEQLARNYSQVLQWNYNNNMGLGKEGFFFGHANRIMNGIFLWEAPFSGQLVWINHDDDINQRSKYNDLQIDNGYRHRTLYTIRDRRTGAVLPTLRLKGYREGVTDFRILQKAAACNPASVNAGVLREVKTLHNTDPSAESLSVRLEDSDLELIRLKAYQEILSSCGY